LIVALRCISILAGIAALILLVMAVISVTSDAPPMLVWPLFGNVASAAVLAVACQAGAEGLGLLYEIRQQITALSATQTSASD